MISARSEAINIAREKLQLEPIFLDTETTGTDVRSEIVEISVIDHSGQILIDTLVRPTLPIPEDAFRVHGISNEMVKDAPIWSDVWSELKKVFAGKHIGVYNADFDLRLMKQSHARHFIPWNSSGFQFFCIMKLYAQFAGVWNPRTRSYRWHSLEIAGKQSGIPLPNSHRALEDAKLAKAVLEFIADQEH